MSDYAQDAADALASIKEAGRQAVIKRLTRDVDPAAGTTSITTSASGLLDMVVLPVSKNDPLDDTLTEALVAGKLRKLLCAAASASFQPKGADVVLFDDLYWLVRGCTTLRPATTDILYTLIVENTDLSQTDIDALELTTLEEEIAELGAYTEP